MANLVRRGRENEMRQRERGEMDPLRMMRELFRFDPFQGMTALPALLAREDIWAPDFEVRETPDAYVFKGDVPGVKEEDLDISLASSRLLISGQRQAEERKESDTYYAYERSYGTFTRAFTLPDDVDAENVSAELKNGVLTLVVPKRPEQQPKKIELKGGQVAPAKAQEGQKQPKERPKA